MSNRADPPFETARQVHDRCLCLHAQRAARALARRFDEAFRPVGLTNGQFSLLMALDRPQPPTIGAVAALLAMDRTTLTAALKPLQRRGLVEVAADGTDRRSRRPRLTARGRVVLAEAAGLWRRAHAELDGLLSAAGVGDLPRGLRALPQLLARHVAVPSSEGVQK